MRQTRVPPPPRIPRVLPKIDRGELNRRARGLPSSRIVEASGPTAARLLIIAEAPGVQEVKHGRPLVGRSGAAVDNGLRRAGLDPSIVRKTNVIPVNEGQLPQSPHAMRERVHRFWSNIDDDMALMQPRCILAVGRAALYRLTGHLGIGKMTGSAWPTDVLPTHVRHGDRPWRIGLPENCVVVACLHPASVMRTKIGAGWLQFDVAVDRAARYALGELQYPEPADRFADQGLDVDMRRNADLDEVDHALTHADHVTIDTEFDPHTGVPYLIGMTVDGRTVYSMDLLEPSGTPRRGPRDLLRKHLTRRDLLKVAHYHTADTTAAAALGIDTCPPWYDTIEAFSHLYPDLPGALGTLGAFYLDNVHWWKGMAHNDPRYNAIDVVVTDCVYRRTWDELSAEPDLRRSFEIERMPVAYLFSVLEHRGLAVDREGREAELERLHAEEHAALGQVLETAGAVFARRVDAQRRQVLECDEQVEAATAELAEDLLRCEVHPTYDGMRKKRFSAREDCVCAQVYEHPVVTEVRDRVSRTKALRTREQAKLDRWTSKGFDPGNHEHVRWLLYDKQALGLKKQYKEGRLSANTDAIARLLRRDEVARDTGVVRLLQNIKAIQHLRKCRSTFLFEGREQRIDADGVVHPPYRAFGAGSGRPAGGADDITLDRRPSPYSFNVLNIPEDCRRIYVPHADGHCPTHTPSASRDHGDPFADDEEEDRE